MGSKTKSVTYTSVSGTRLHLRDPLFHVCQIPDVGATRAESLKGKAHHIVRSGGGTSSPKPTVIHFDQVLLNLKVEK